MSKQNKEIKVGDEIVVNCKSYTIDKITKKNKTTYYHSRYLKFTNEHVLPTEEKEKEEINVTNPESPDNQGDQSDN